MFIITTLGVVVRLLDRSVSETQSRSDDERDEVSDL